MTAQPDFKEHDMTGVDLIAAERRRHSESPGFIIVTLSDIKPVEADQ